MEQVWNSGYTPSPRKQLIINAIGELSELPVYIDDTPYQGMVEIRGKAGGWPSSMDSTWC